MNHKYDRAEVQRALDVAASDIKNIVKRLHQDFPGVLFGVWITGEGSVIHAYGYSARGRVTQVNSRRFELGKRRGNAEAIFARSRNPKPLANPQ